VADGAATQLASMYAELLTHRPATTCAPVDRSAVPPKLLPPALHRIRPPSDVEHWIAPVRERVRGLEG
jgi:hypothetical protein